VIALHQWACEGGINKRPNRVMKGGGWKGRIAACGAGETGRERVDSYNRRLWRARLKHRHMKRSYLNMCSCCE